MKEFAIAVTLAALVLTMALILTGRINQRRVPAAPWLMVACYSERVKYLCLAGYLVVSAVPLLIADILKEGNPLLDRLGFLLIHAMFVLMIVWLFNRRIVLTDTAVWSSGMFGRTVGVDNARLAGAASRKWILLVQGTVFHGDGYRIMVDDQMQNQAAMIAALRQRAAASSGARKTA